MWQCEQCDLTFETFQAKANHVRWTHKERAYSEEGLERIKENARQITIKRYGEATKVTEERTCRCGQKFMVTFSPERKAKVRKTCSQKCAKTRDVVITQEMKEQIRTTLRQRGKENPEIYMKGFRAVASRFSSKAERALAETLIPFGFKRHKYITVEGLTFDVDIISNDGRVWIESDGEWHFRQVHAGHNFEATQMRDRLEEQEAVIRNVLLIRVNNQVHSIEKQVQLIQEAIKNWNGTGCVIKYYDP